MEWQKDEEYMKDSERQSAQWVGLTQIQLGT